MKIVANAHWLSLVVLLFSCTAATAAENPAPRAEDVVLRYFKQVLDGQNISILDEILRPDVVMRRPEQTINGIAEARAFFEGAPLC